MLHPQKSLLGQLPGMVMAIRHRKRHTIPHELMPPECAQSEYICAFPLQSSGTSSKILLLAKRLSYFHFNTDFYSKIFMACDELKLHLWIQLKGD